MATYSSMRIVGQYEHSKFTIQEKIKFFFFTFKFYFSSIYFFSLREKNFLEIFGYSSLLFPKYHIDLSFRFLKKRKQWNVLLIITSNKNIETFKEKVNFSRIIVYRTNSPNKVFRTAKYLFLFPLFYKSIVPYQMGVCHSF